MKNRSRVRPYHVIFLFVVLSCITLQTIIPFTSISNGDDAWIHPVEKTSYVISGPSPNEAISLHPRNDLREPLLFSSTRIFVEHENHILQIDIPYFGYYVPVKYMLIGLLYLKWRVVAPKEFVFYSQLFWNTSLSICEWKLIG